MTISRQEYNKIIQDKEKEKSIEELVEKAIKEIDDIIISGVVHTKPKYNFYIDPKINKIPNCNIAQKIAEKYRNVGWKITINGYGDNWGFTFWI